MPIPLTDEEKMICLKAALSSLDITATFLRHADVHEFDAQLATLAAFIRQRVQEAEQKAAEVLARKEG